MCNYSESDDFLICLEGGGRGKKKIISSPCDFQQ